MNILELIEMIHDNFTESNISYCVDMVEYSHEVDTASRPARAYTREFNHEVKYFYTVDDVIQFLFECDTSFWELTDWRVSNYTTNSTLTNDGEWGSPVIKEGTLTITLRRYDI